jgi:hypothetical protein
MQLLQQFSRCHRIDHNAWACHLDAAIHAQNSTETLEQLEHAFDNIKRKLFSELHEVVRQQVFPALDASSASAASSAGTMQETQIDLDAGEHDDEATRVAPAEEAAAPLDARSRNERAAAR